MSYGAICHVAVMQAAVILGDQAEAEALVDQLLLTRGLAWWDQADASEFIEAARANAANRLASPEYDHGPVIQPCHMQGSTCPGHLLPQQVVAPQDQGDH